MARIGMGREFYPRSQRLRVTRDSDPNAELPFKVTIDGIDAKEWLGRTEQDAIRAATKESREMWDRAAVEKVPEWQKEEVERGKEEDRLWGQVWETLQS